MDVFHNWALTLSISNPTTETLLPYSRKPTMPGIFNRKEHKERKKYRALIFVISAFSAVKSPLDS